MATIAGLYDVGYLIPLPHESKESREFRETMKEYDNRANVNVILFCNKPYVDAVSGKTTRRDEYDH